MLDKITTFSVSLDDITIIDHEMIKTASIQLPDDVEYDPDFLYMKLKSVSAGEYWGPNNNADYFPEEELTNNYNTFLNAHHFKNHENKDVEKAIGDVLKAEWNDKMKAVYLITRMDSKVAPSIVRGFEKGWMTDVSMGCRIKYSICSYCGNKARTKREYCEHIRKMRNKILEDGRRIYEINIGPKFHDISAVLNGAEKSAKVVNMIISGSKVALDISKDQFMEKMSGKSGSNMMEKVASDNFLNDKGFAIKTEFKGDDGFFKEANDKIIDNLEIFPKDRLSKSDYLKKVAEIKKEISNTLTSVADGEFLDDRVEAVEKLKGTLRLLTEDYWSKEKCDDIANRIRGVAIKKRIPIEIAFEQFLKTLEFTGIELTPLEFSEISSNLLGCECDLRDKELPPPNMDTFEDDVSKHDLSSMIGFPTMFSTIKDGILPNLDLVKNKLGENPVGRMKAIIIKIKKPVAKASTDIEDMIDIIRNDIPKRSMRGNFLIKRILNSPDDISESNEKHFSPISILKNGSSEDTNSLLNMLMFSNLTGVKKDILPSDERQYLSVKHASILGEDGLETVFEDFAIEKSASKDAYKYGLKPKANLLGKGYTHRKALALGIPLTFGYSALQRSRQKNNENISGINKYVADNPANAAALQALFGPMAAKGIVRSGKIMAGKAKEVSDRAVLGKSLSDKQIEKLLGKKGKGHVLETRRLFNEAQEIYDNDIFKNASIDNELSKKYSDKQIKIIKYATVYSGFGEESLANEILASDGLNQDDILNYLQICKNCIKIEIESKIEKCAEDFASGVGKDTALFSLFSSPKVSLSTSLPGTFLDSVIFRAIDKKLSKQSDNFKKTQSSNNKSPVKKTLEQ